MEKTYEMLQQYAVNSLEYQKGRALHQRGQAALSSAEEAHGRTQIQATVRDLSRRYDVEMTIQSTGLAADGNWGDFDIEESSCSCGEYHTPGKLCRHEIAAVLNNKEGACWRLWRNIAAQDKSFGNPDKFCTNIEETNWESATITTLDEKIPPM